MSTNKIEEAQQHLREAEKNLKTGILKWRPDYNLAADDYEKAATLFRVAGSNDQSLDCLRKAIDCHKHNKSWFHAGKCYEQIIMVLKEKGNLLEIEENANRACNMYQQYGNFDAAAKALDKAAKMLIQKHPDVALRFYQHALEVVMADDGDHNAAEYACKVSRLFVKLQLYDQAADAIRREIGLNQQIEAYGIIGRLAVALVLVQLARGDFVAAEKAFKEWGNCCDAQEVQTLEMLLQAFDDEDPQTAAQALSSGFIKSMDVEYAILAKSIQLPQGVSIAAGASAKNKPTTSQHTPIADDSNTFADNPRADDDDDDEAGGLC